MFFLSKMEAFPALFYIVPGKCWTVNCQQSVLYVYLTAVCLFSQKHRQEVGEQYNELSMCSYPIWHYAYQHMANIVSSPSIILKQFYHFSRKDIIMYFYNTKT